MSRTVVVTGGTKGIGLAAVGRFLELGDRVVALGREQSALDAVAELGATGVRCDVTDEDEVGAAFGSITEIDVLVNNAGIAESAPLAKTSLDLWNRHFAVNVTGAFLCLRAVVPGIRERGAGAIVTVASTAGRVGAPYTSAYAASKHAAVGLTRAVASELAGTGVRVNAFVPDVRGHVTDGAIDRRIVETTGRSAQETEAALAASSPLGRLLAPEEVADAIVFLASSAAAAITGQALVIDGGGIQA